MMSTEQWNRLFSLEENGQFNRRTSMKKRKVHQEKEVCRVCGDESSGSHFGVFTCDACKGFFRRCSKRVDITNFLPCPGRCLIKKFNRNNCTACRFDKCKSVGMTLTKKQHGTTIDHVSNFNVQLEPNDEDSHLMFRLLEFYQSFEENPRFHSSVIVEFCHHLTKIVMNGDEQRDELYRSRFKRHQSTIQFLITGEHEQQRATWSRERRAWTFANNERWRLLMILLILAFDDEQLSLDESSQLSNQFDVDRILRLFELECDQERQRHCQQITSSSFILSNSRTIKSMKAQFVLRFIDMITDDLITSSSNLNHASRQSILNDIRAFE